MKPIICITILSLSILTLNSHIELVQCRSFFESSSFPPISAPSPSIALAPGNDAMYSLSPDSSPMAMPDADGDLIELPIDFNPFDSKQEEAEPTIPVHSNVKKTCESTDNPELCISSLVPFFEEEKKEGKKEEKTDTLTLLLMQVKATEQATEIASALSAKLGQKEKDKVALKDCKDMYDDALDNLKKALSALDSKDVGTVNTMLSAAISDFHTCDDGFKDGGHASPLGDYGKKLSDLVSNCLATVSLMKGTQEE